MSASTSLFRADLLRAALREAVIKLDPRQLIANPVMFVTALVASLSTLLLAATLLGGGHDAGFQAQLVFWLWLTVLFGNFAEALAEGRGKAQAASLRATKAELTAKVLGGPGGAYTLQPASALEVR